VVVFPTIVTVRLTSTLEPRLNRGRLDLNLDHSSHLFSCSHYYEQLLLYDRLCARLFYFMHLVGTQMFYGYVLLKYDTIWYFSSCVENLA
jgi:hypothetical protein